MIRRVVVCDSCHSEGQNADGLIVGSSAASVRAQARDGDGWHARRGRDICGECWSDGER